MGLQDMIPGASPLKAVMGTQLSRRAMLVRAGAVGGVALAAPLLAACGGGSSATATKATSAATATTASGGATPTTAPAVATATKATVASPTTATGAATATTGTTAPTATTAAAPTATTVAVAPTATTGTGGTPKVGGTWTLVLAQEPDTLDAHKQGSYVSGVVYRYLGDTLIEKNPDDATIQPALATKYDISSDGLTTTFTLQDGIMFHDGTAVDAAAVKACYDRALDPATKSAVTIGQLGPIDTITATDASTVVFKHTQSYSVFLDNMAHPVCSIISVPAATAAGDQFGRNPVATGPWKFVDWQAGTEITLQRNTDYNWSPSFAHKGPAYIDKLVIRFFSDPGTLTAAFEAGEVDQIEIPYPDIPRLKDTGQFETLEFYRPSATFMEFQVTKAPFDDVHLRKAFNYTIDPQPVIDASLEGNGRPLYSALPQTIWGWWPGSVDYAYKPDPAKAQEEFTAAGWIMDGGVLKKDGQPLSFTFTTISGQAPQVTGAQVLQSQLKAAGVDMQIESVDFSTVITRLKAGDYQVSFIGYSYASPDIVYIWFDSKNIGGGLNLSHYSNPDLDKLIDDSRSVIDQNQRLKDYEDIQKLVIDNAIWVPLYEASTTYGLTKRLAGYKIHPDGHLHLFEAYITD